MIVLQRFVYFSLAVKTTFNIQVKLVAYECKKLQKLLKVKNLAISIRRRDKTTFVSLTPRKNVKLCNKELLDLLEVTKPQQTSMK